MYNSPTPLGLGLGECPRSCGGGLRKRRRGLEHHARGGTRTSRIWFWISVARISVLQWCRFRFFKLFFWVLGSDSLKTNEGCRFWFSHGHWASEGSPSAGCTLGAKYGAEAGETCVLFFPTRQEGVVRFCVGIRVCDASTPRPHPVSRQSCSPVDPAQYPARAARQWIPPSIPPE